MVTNDYQPTKKATVFSTFENWTGNWEAIPTAGSWSNHKGTATVRNPIKAGRHHDQQLFQLQTMPYLCRPLSLTAALCLVRHTESQWCYATCLLILPQKNQIYPGERRWSKFPTSRKMTPDFHQILSKCMNLPNMHHIQNSRGDWELLLYLCNFCKTIQIRRKED